MRCGRRTLAVLVALMAGSLVGVSVCPAGQQQQAGKIVLKREKIDEAKDGRQVTWFYECYPGAKVKEFTIVLKMLKDKDGMDTYRRNINAAGWVRTGVKEADMMESKMLDKAKADICEGKAFSKEWSKTK